MLEKGNRVASKTIRTITFTIVCSNFLSDSDRPKNTKCDIASGAKQLDVMIAIVLCDGGLRRRLYTAEGG